MNSYCQFDNYQLAIIWIFNIYLEYQLVENINWNMHKSLQLFDAKWLLSYQGNIDMYSQHWINL